MQVERLLRGLSVLKASTSTLAVAPTPAPRPAFAPVSPGPALSASDPTQAVQTRHLNIDEAQLQLVIKKLISLMDGPNCHDFFYKAVGLHEDIVNKSQTNNGNTNDNWKPTICLQLLFVRSS